jgi:O-antigen/teichoic acid export membrane protein
MASDKMKNPKKNTIRDWLFPAKTIPLLSHPFINDVAIVALGPIFSQIVSTLLSPVYSRLYSPEEFGALGVFLSILSVFVPIANLSLSYAIILPKRDKDATAVLHLNLIFSLIVSTILLLIITIFYQQIVALLNFHDYANYLYFIPLALIFTTASIAYDEWMVRNKQFSAASVITISQSILSNLVQLGMGFLTPMYKSLIGVNIFSRGFHAIFSFLDSTHKCNKAGSRKVS